MQHEHLSFYGNSMSAGTRTITLGGSDIIPSLHSSNRIDGQTAVDNRTNVEKHIAIVEYLKRLPKSSRATYVDIERELNIDLNQEIGLLGILKSNPKVDVEIDSQDDRQTSFMYRSKFNISNRNQLLNEIFRVGNGIVMTDIKDCYPGIESDINSFIIGGDIIANKNKEMKSLVLYPRGMPFIVKLSGVVTATQGEQQIATSANLLPEIRRGEAIQVDNVWYRISSAIGSGALNQQNSRSVAPTSVTSDKELSSVNVYCDPYTEKTLPLDGDFEGATADNTNTENNNSHGNAVVYTGAAYKHGATNDIKELWTQSMESGLKAYLGDEAGLERYLLESKMISTLYSGTSDVKSNKKTVVKKQRKTTLRRAQTQNSTNYGVNAHLRGSAMGRILEETRKKEESR